MYRDNELFKSEICSSSNIYRFSLVLFFLISEIFFSEILFLCGRLRSPLFEQHVVLDLVVVRPLCGWQPTARSMAASLNASSTISLRTSSPKGQEEVAV